MLILVFKLLLYQIDTYNIMSNEIMNKKDNTPQIRTFREH